MLLFVGCNSYVTAIDSETGETVWTTSMASMGSYHVNLIAQDGRLYAGCNGKVQALDPRTGRVFWENGLAGEGYAPVTLATELGSSQATAEESESRG